MELREEKQCREGTVDQIKGTEIDSARRGKKRQLDGGNRVGFGRFFFQ